jgi:prepilin-type N-terminal cleavage/methylation domain-containing protein
MNKQFKRGFTLVEMMIVVAIIAVLAGVALPQYTKYVKKSETVEGINFMRQIADAEILYESTHGAYYAADTKAENGVANMTSNLFVTVPANSKFKNFKVLFCSENGGGFKVMATTQDAVPGNDKYSIFMMYPKTSTGSIFINNYVNEETGNEPTCTTPTGT